jgi:hypothetical protein
MLPNTKTLQDVKEKALKKRSTFLWWLLVVVCWLLELLVMQLCSYKYIVSIMKVRFGENRQYCIYPNRCAKCWRKWSKREIPGEASVLGYIFIRIKSNARCKRGCLERGRIEG